MLSPAFQKDHQRWALNAASARQHTFCAGLCVNFKAAGGLQKEEQACMNSCFSKFSSALSIFNEEKTHYMNSLADLALRGEDKYAARHIV